MPFIIATTVLGVAFILYKIATESFPDTYSRFFNGCYIVAYLPLVVLVVAGSINPAWRGNEALWYFIIYIPLFAAFILPFTFVPVIIAHIACKIKYRGAPKSAGSEKKRWWKAPAVYYVGGLAMMFSFFPILSFAGFLLTAGVCVYGIVRFIMR